MNEDHCNICVTVSCVKLMYYPRCLGNKVVLSKSHELCVVMGPRLLGFLIASCHTRCSGQNWSISYESTK